MNFLNPFVLFGLVAASIPIILHLINLRKQKTIEFSTLRFLKELQKSSIKKLKIKQWLLLLLRTLLIIFAVLAFSRPTIESSLPGFMEYSNTSMIILLDNSYSMDVSDENGNRFRQAKKVASDLISSMKEGDQAVIFPLASSNPLRSYSWSFSKDQLKKKLDAIKIGTNKADLGTNLKFASILSKEATNLNKVIYLVSDMQDNIISNADTSKFFNQNIALLIAHIGKKSKKSFSNLSIDSARIISSIIQKDNPIEIETFVHNRSDKRLSDNLMSLLYDGEKVAQSVINIAPNETKSIVISAPYNKTGIVKGELQLENDELITDNSFYFALNIPKQPYVIVVSETPNLFLSAVLKNLQSFNAISGYTFNDKINTFQEGQEKILIVAKNSLSQSDIDYLSKLQSTNSKIIMFAPKDNLEEFISASQNISLKIKGISRYSAKPGEFTKVDKLHPIFDGVFKGVTANQKEVESPDIKLGLPTLNGRAIIETANGNFLSQYDTGNSTILYFSVPLSTDWSNFPVIGLFPTLIYKSIVYLNSDFDAGVEDKNNTLIISTDLSPIPKFTILDPSGKEFFEDAVRIDNNYVLQVADKTQFGTYLVKNNNNQIVAYYNVNHDKSESNLNSIESDKFSKSMKEIGIGEKNISILQDLKNVKDSIQRAKLGTELWQIFLALALLCGLAELIVEKATKNTEE